MPKTVKTEKAVNHPATFAHSTRTQENINQTSTQEIGLFD